METIAASVLVAVAYLLFSSALRLLGGKAAHRDIDGAPAWNYYVSLTSQGLIFPGVAIWRALAAHHDGMPFAAWACQPAASLASVERLPHATIMGYMLCDACTVYDTLPLLCHHFTCFVCTLGAAVGTFGIAPNLLLLGSIVLEFGSGVRNYAFMHPTRATCNAAVGAIGISNLLSLLIAAYTIKVAADHGRESAAARLGPWITFLVTVGLCAGRQLLMNAKYREVVAADRAAAEAKVS